MTEKYYHGSKEWMEVPGAWAKMPHMLRSSGYAVRNNNPTLIGGVKSNQQ